MLQQRSRTKARVHTLTVCALLLSAALFAPSIVNAGWLTEQINEFFYSIAFMLGGIVVTIGGLALDFALHQLVFQMGTLMQGGIGASVNTVWVIIRDAFNLLFIFGLIYIGLRIIWDSDDSGTRRALGSLIIAALLINFSLFIAKFIVDFSNIAAVQIYNLMAGTLEINGLDGNSVANFWTSTAGGIPAYVMHLVGMQTVANSVAGGFGLAVMIFIFLVFTGLVFLAGALMIVTRFVYLCFYMIFSPVMFLGLILPKLKSHQDKWWDNFLKQAFFAPAYLFCVYIALRILASARQTPTLQGEFGENMEALAGGRDAGFVYNSTSGDGFGAVMFLIIALGFMIASVLLANKMSIHGASTSMMMIKGARSRMQRFAGSATSGMAARVGRNTAGAASQRLVDNDKFKSLAARSGTLGRVTYQKAQGVADSSFDARRVKVGGKTIGNQLNIGEGKKGGYTTSIKEDTKKHKEFLDSLGTRNKDEVKKEAQADAKVLAQAAVLKTAQVNTAEAKQTETKAKETLEAKQKVLDDTKVPLAAQQKVVEDAVSKHAAKQMEILVATAPETSKIQTLTNEYSMASEDRKKEITSEVTALSAMVDSKKASFADDIKTLEANIDTARAGVKTIDTSIEAAQSDVEAAKANVSAAQAAIKAAETTEQKEATKLKGTTELAETRLTYQHQLDYIKKIEGQMNVMSKVGARVGAVLGGVTAGLVTLGNVPAIAGGAAAGALVGGAGGRTFDPAVNYRNKEAATSLWKEYGQDGTSKAKSKKKKDELKILSEQLKDTDGDGKPDEPEKVT